MKTLLVFFLLCFGTPAFAFVSLPEGSGYDVGFSPNGTALGVVLQGIAAAEKTVLVAAYSFTSKPVALALLEAHTKGVKVAVVADKKGNSNGYTAVTFLANHGVPIRLNGHLEWWGRPGERLLSLNS